MSKEEKKKTAKGGEGRRSERTRRSLRARRFPLRRLVESAAESGYLFADSEFDFVQFLTQEMAMKNSRCAKAYRRRFSHPRPDLLNDGIFSSMKSCFLATRIIR